ncbi:galactose mutarotase-like protein [Laetiporus sulphureus 93-53]|uniref:Galactose mutarotase-like protein n=1 Tax=Laetiporus sulphureus 93-53 TaxID=1314785 RepID=A0A165BF96_9APHY|nr:galactose mutarotase-like protein [Laetiporus sulphureus 93-53]KZT00930.1 galactose mutarotase-like protein [Laetiporus sulphureus 93-53]
MATTESDPSLQPILLTLPSLTPSLALEILPYGLTLHRLFVQADGKTHDILIGPESPAGHITQKYTNTIIGRYANRVPVGTHALARNGLSASLTAIANESPSVSLHGGPVGFDSLPWEPLMDPSQAELFTQAELATAMAEIPAACVFRRISEDGEEGYPGRLLVEVLVGLVQPKGPPVNEGKEWNLGSVLIVYRAKLLDEGKVTPLNMTQHWGFNLDASLQEGQSIKDHKLKIKADNTILLASDANSAGSLLPVQGTHHAHAEKETGTIGERFPPNGYDEFYLFSDRSVPIPPTRLAASDLTAETDLLKGVLDTEAREPVVELAGAKSGLRVTFDTNQSGVQFYSNNFADPAKQARKKIHGGSGAVGDGYEPCSAAFLEFHEPLAAWLFPGTQGPSANDTLLASGEVYNNFVRMDVWYRSPERL